MRFTFSQAAAERQIAAHIMHNAGVNPSAETNSGMHTRYDHTTAFPMVLAVLLTPEITHLRSLPTGPL